MASAGVGYALGTQLFKSLWKLMHKNQAMILTEVCNILFYLFIENLMLQCSYICQMYVLTLSMALHVTAYCTSS